MKFSAFALSWSLLAGIINLQAANLPVSAEEISYPKQAFDATYETKTKANTITTRMISDGKGHVRTESDANGQKSISIADYPGKTITTLLQANKMVIKTPIKGGAGVTDEDSAKKAGAKSLGTQKIENHPCHGYEMKNGDVTTDTWIGDDIKYLVKSDMKSPSGTTTMTLKAFSSKAPDVSMFTVPAGYKEMKMPGMPSTH